LGIEPYGLGIFIGTFWEEVLEEIMIYVKEKEKKRRRKRIKIVEAFIYLAASRVANIGDL
jgi:hypothetical protein